MKHDFCLPVPVPPDTYTLRSVSSDEEPAACEDVAQSSSAQSDPNYAPVPDINEPHVISQEELNDLIRDLDLPKSKALLLASRLQQWNLLNQNVNISMYRKREVRLVPNFTKDGDLVYCSDIPSLMGQLKLNYNTEDWRLFVDSFRISLKAVLLHNGNEKPSIPIAHAVHMKETYENMRNLLQAIKYEQFQWSICADLKVIAILTGLQGGYTKHCCFLCHWDSRAKDQYTITKWPPRKQLVPWGDERG